MTIEDKIDTLITDVAVIKSELKKFPQDHETRIRVLEDHKSKIAGSLVTLSAIGSFIGLVLGLVIAFISK